MNKLDILYLKNKYWIFYKLAEKFVPTVSIIVVLIIVTGYVIGYLLEQTNEIAFYISIFILLYFIRWILRGFEIIIFTIAAVVNFIKYKKINFHNILFKSPKTKIEKRYKNILSKKDLNPNDIIHWFIIPTYKESFDILDQTLYSLTKANYPLNKFAVTIAWEKADENNFLQIIKKLEEKYKNSFWYFNWTIHQLQENEIPGKWANIKFHAKNLYKKIIQKFQTTPDKILVTTLDADTNIDPNYPNMLTYEYIITPNRKQVAYQPLILFFNNFWESPFFSKIVGLSNSFRIIFNATKKYWVRNFSTHAQSLDALIELDFWSNQTIVEDGHQYRRSYFGFNGNYYCKFIYTCVYQDLNLNINLLKTAKAQYNQMRRWAHWVEDVPYIIFQWKEKWKNLPFFRTLYELLRLIEWTIMWATLHIVLFLWISLTIIKDITLSSYITLGQSIDFFVKLSYIILIFVVLLQIFFTPRNWLKNSILRIFEFVKFFITYSIFIGPTLIFFSWTPALHTQIMILLWKPMKKFNVTIKVRKKQQIDK